MRMTEEAKDSELRDLGVKEERNVWKDTLGCYLLFLRC